MYVPQIETQPRPRAAVPGHRAALAAMVLLALASAVIRLWDIASYPLDSDEVFTLLGARHGWADMLTYAARDLVHPPLIYVLVKLWRALGGESAVWLRLLPFLFSLLAFPALVRLMRNVALPYSAQILAFALLAANPFVAHYSIHLRNYTLFLFLSLWAMAVFIEWVRSPSGRGFAALALLHLALAWCHYFSAFLFAAQLLVVLVFQRVLLKRYVLLLAGISIAFLPWLIAAGSVFLQNRGLGKNLAWTEKPDLIDLAWFYHLACGNLDIPKAMTLSFVLFFTPIAYAALRWLRERDPGIRPDAMALIALVAVTAPLAIFTLSHLAENSMWGTRHMLSAIAAVMLLVAYAVWRLPHRWLRRATAALIVLWAGCAAWQHVHKPGKKMQIDALLTTMERVEPRTAGVVPVYAFEPAVAVSLRFLMERQQRFALQSRIYSLDEIRAPYGWIALRDTTWKRYHAGPPEHELRARGFTVHEQFRFPAATQALILMRVSKPPAVEK
jgi:uncharacterized membrane protein